MKRYEAEIATTVIYLAVVEAGSLGEARRKAQAGEYARDAANEDLVWATGEVRRRTVTSVRLEP